MLYHERRGAIDIKLVPCVVSKATPNAPEPAPDVVFIFPNNATLESQAEPLLKRVPSFTPNLPIEDVSAIDVFPVTVLRAA
jgi:hypothetical protein